MNIFEIFKTFAEVENACSCWYQANHKNFCGSVLEFLEKENQEVNHFTRNIILLLNFPNHIHRQI